MKTITWDVVPITKFRIVRCEVDGENFGDVPLKALAETIESVGTGGSVEHLGEFDTEAQAAKVSAAMQKEELAQTSRGVMSAKAPSP